MFSYCWMRRDQGSMIIFPLVQSGTCMSWFSTFSMGRNMKLFMSTHRGAKGFEVWKLMMDSCVCFKFPRGSQVQWWRSG